MHNHFTGIRRHRSTHRGRNEDFVKNNLGRTFTEFLDTCLARRHLLQGGGGLIAASALPGSVAKATTRAVAQTRAETSAVAAPDLTGRLARYMMAAREPSLPARGLL